MTLGEFLKFSFTQKHCAHLSLHKSEKGRNKVTLPSSKYFLAANVKLQHCKVVCKWWDYFISVYFCFKAFSLIGSSKFNSLPSLSIWLVQSFRRGNAQHKKGRNFYTTSKLKFIILFVYKLRGYRNTVYNNNNYYYIIDTTLSCISTGWEWLATFPHLHSLIYTARNYIRMSLVEIWNTNPNNISELFITNTN